MCFTNMSSYSSHITNVNQTVSKPTMAFKIVAICFMSIAMMECCHSMVIVPRTAFLFGANSIRNKRHHMIVGGWRSNGINSDTHSHHSPTPFVLEAHFRRNQYYRSSTSARNNANSTEFEVSPSSTSSSSKASSGTLTFPFQDDIFQRRNEFNGFFPSNNYNLGSTAVTTATAATAAGTGSLSIQANPIASGVQPLSPTHANEKVHKLAVDRSISKLQNDCTMFMSNNKTFFTPVSKNRNQNSHKKSTRIKKTNSFSMINSATDTIDEEEIVKSNARSRSRKFIKKENDNDEMDNNFKSNKVCRIVASADYKIPSLHHQQQNQSSLLTDIDAITHATSHQNSQKQLYYMESIQRAYRIIKDDRNSTIYDTQLYNQQEEENVVSTLRQSLEASGFQLLNERDIQLCEALNAGYLLRLSILPDVSQLDPSIGREFYPELYKDRDVQQSNVQIDTTQDARKQNEDDENDDDDQSTSHSKNGLLYDGRILVYRRGYSEEVTSGRLLLPKFDYLQSSLVQRTASNFARKLGNIEKRVSNRIWTMTQAAITKIVNEMPNLLVQLISKVTGFNSTSTERNDNDSSSIISDFDDESFESNKFKLGRYRSGGFMESNGSTDDALSPFLVCEVAENDQSEMDTDKDLYDVLKSGSLACQHDLNGKNATNGVIENNQVQLLKRVSIANLVDFFSDGGRRRLLKSLFSKSELVEPTYEEVILIWRPLPDKTKKKRDFQLPNYVYDIAEIFEVENRLPEKSKPEPKPLPLEIRAFDRVPMANLLAVFPKTKLIFRPADAFIFDLINITTFLAVLSSVRFDSPKLDILAIVSGVLWVLRTFFRYSNKLARYDLLVNKFLTSRISHRNSGALRYAVNEAAIQKARRASLVHEWLVQFVKENAFGPILTREYIVYNGVSEINKMYQSKQPIQLDLDIALNDLVELDLIRFTEDDSKILIDVKEGKAAKESLRGAWNDIYD